LSSCVRPGLSRSVRSCSPSMIFLHSYDWLRVMAQELVPLHAKWMDSACAETTTENSSAAKSMVSLFLRIARSLPKATIVCQDTPKEYRFLLCGRLMRTCAPSPCSSWGLWQRMFMSCWAIYGQRTPQIRYHPNFFCVVLANLSLCLRRASGTPDSPLPAFEQGYRVSSNASSHRGCRWLAGRGRASAYSFQEYVP